MYCQSPLDFYADRSAALLGSGLKEEMESIALKEECSQGLKGLLFLLLGGTQDNSSAMVSLYFFFPAFNSHIDKNNLGITM